MGDKGKSPISESLAAEEKGLDLRACNTGCSGMAQVKRALLIWLIISPSNIGVSGRTEIVPQKVADWCKNYGAALRIWFSSIIFKLMKCDFMQ